VFIKVGWDRWESKWDNPTEDLYETNSFQILMALQRKVREVGNSLNVVIPSQIADLHNIDEETILEFEPMEQGVFKLRKIAQMCTVRKKGTEETKKIPSNMGRCIPPKGWEKA